MKRSQRLRSFSLFQRLVALLLSGLMPLTTLPEVALALPHGGVVPKGAATLSYGTTKLLITQTTASATFDWGSFNVRSGQSVVYKTPGSTAVSMNYIGGTTPSSIDGSVTSNGILYFMNPNGLIFGSGSVVSAAGVMAFGSSTPWGKPTGAVNNAGVLTATNNGTVALVGTSVTNTGTIMAPGGEVLLAAGSTVTPITATDGSSLSVATTGGGLVDDSGIISADTANGKTGKILLQSGMESGTVTLEPTAVLDASAPKGENGGQVVINASGVVLDNTAPINVSAPYGTNGTIKIDPNYILSGTTLDICNAAGLESINKNQSSLTIGSTTTDPLTDAINLESSMNLSNGSTPYNWTPLGNSSTPFIGTFNGNGHVVSGYTITATANDAGFIGYLGTIGEIKNLGVDGTVDGGSNSNIGGIVGYNAGMVKFSYNMGELSGNDVYVGGIAGYNSEGGIVELSYNTGTVSGGADVGGIVGGNFATVKASYNIGNVSAGCFMGGITGYNGSIVENSYNTGNISGSSGSTSHSFDVGGIVGDNSGGTVKYSYDTGNLSGFETIGGIVGYDVGGGIVEYSYVIGTVTGSADVGGIVGDNTSTVKDNYYIKATNNEGAIGCNSGTSINNNSISQSDFAATNSSTAGVSNLGAFSTWNQSSGTLSVTGPWVEGSVVSSNGLINAPMLVADLPTAIVTGQSGTSVYNGLVISPGYITTYTMGGEAIPSGITVSTSVGPNAGTYTVTPTVSGTISSAPATQTSVDFVSTASGTWTITPAPLKATANPVTMTYGSTVPMLSGTVTGLVGSQTLSGDDMTVSWSTDATSSSSAGAYKIVGEISVLVGSPYTGDYTITEASENATALTITAANSTSGLSGSSGSGSSSSGPGTPGGVTSTHFPPVAQTANVSVSASGNSSSDNLSDTANSSSSGDSITLSSSNGSSLSVVPTGGGETTGDAILSTQELKQ